MDDERRRHEAAHMAALAGLLHDVGKFAQRAGQRPDTASEAFGPQDYGGHGAHARWSITFIQERVPERWRSGLAPVLFHHRPNDRLSKVVALADRLSAAERESAEEAGARQLTSIFCRLGSQTERPPERVWPLEELRLTEDAVFPIQVTRSGDERGAYGRLWAGFDAAVAALPGGDLPAYIEGLLHALRRYTWCVPSAFYRSVPDVSLYDHSRTTAALAACLTEFDEPMLDDLLAGRRADEPVVLLVGGDVSGVQDFIYTVTAQGAAKGLRGRSFYLQMLTEAVARFILRDLGLPVTNLVYAGGGHFYLLAPVDAAARLASLRSTVSRKLLLHHGGELYLALGWAKLSTADFRRERFGDAWRRANEAVNAAKRQRFAELQDPALLDELVFGPSGAGGLQDSECSVCHFDGPVRIERKPEGEERRICALCDSFEDLGTHLRDARYVVLAELPPRDVEPSPDRRGTLQDALESFGLGMGLTAANGSPLLPVPPGAARATLLAIDDTGDAAQEAKRLSRRLVCPVAPGVRYTVNVTPRKASGDIATFDWLQEQSRGVQRLGVLRMDVDDLGDLFGRGLEGEATLSRVAALSSALALFFEGWVGELCRELNPAPGKDRIYAIYSGGDDLFIVGSWDALPGLAWAIRNDLNRFAAAHPAVHISGGLTLHSGKYPLYQAAEDAEGALAAAKDLVRADGRRKDALSFLGLEIPWEAFDDLQSEQRRLVRLVAEDGADRSLLRTLLQLYARASHAIKERGKPYWGPWMWQGAYRLKRMEDQIRKRNPKVAEEIGSIRDSLGKEGFRRIEVLGPAARWAELLIRKGVEER